MRGDYLGNVIHEIILENGPMDVSSLARMNETRSTTVLDIRLVISEDSRFVYDDSGRVHLTTQNGDT